MAAGLYPALKAASIQPISALRGGERLAAAHLRGDVGVVAGASLALGEGNAPVRCDDSVSRVATEVLR